MNHIYYCTFALNTYTSTFNQFPRELIQIMINIMNPKYETFCGVYNTIINTSDDCISFGREHTIPKDIMMNAKNIFDLLYNYVILTHQNIIHTIDHSGNISTTKYDFPIDKIFCSFNVTILISKNTMYTYGGNNCGQLGQGHFKSTQIPQIVNINDVIDAKCTEKHTIILTKGGIPFSCGSNIFGELGIGDGVDNLNIPQKINLIDIISVYCTYATSFFLDKHGNLFKCGVKNYNYSARDYYPIKMSLSNIKSINCGFQYALILDEKGQLHYWGDNDYGINGRYNVDVNSCKKMNFTLEISNVVCGYHHAVLITKSNQFYGCGSNYCGKIKDETIDTYYTPQLMNVHL